MSARIIIFVVVFLVLAATLGVYFASRNQIVAPVVENPTERTISNSEQPTQKANPTPIALRTVKGAVVSVSGDTVVVKGASGDESLSIAKTTDIQKVTLSGGVNKITGATKADIKAGQQVSMAVLEGSNEVMAVIIN